MAAPRGMPRKTPTEVATVVYEMSMVDSEPGLKTRMKRREMGAKRTIWRRELTATRMAQ
jgi:hypothetical protein